MDKAIDALLRRAFVDMNMNQTDDAILALKESQYFKVLSHKRRYKE